MVWTLEVLEVLPLSRKGRSFGAGNVEGKTIWRGIVRPAGFAKEWDTRRSLVSNAARVTEEADLRDALEERIGLCEA
jgi:hypothetical protein